MRALRILSLPLVILAALIASPAATAAAPRYILVGVNGTNVLRVASPAVLAIFRAHRVPVRI